jgi:hypothetical protein
VTPVCWIILRVRTIDGLNLVFPTSKYREAQTDDPQFDSTMPRVGGMSEDKPLN